MAVQEIKVRVMRDLEESGELIEEGEIRKGREDTGKSRGTRNTMPVQDRKDSYKIRFVCNGCNMKLH